MILSDQSDQVSLSHFRQVSAKVFSTCGLDGGISERAEEAFPVYEVPCTAFDKHNLETKSFFIDSIILTGTDLLPTGKDLDLETRPSSGCRWSSFLYAEDCRSPLQQRWLLFSARGANHRLLDQLPACYDRSRTSPSGGTRSCRIATTTSPVSSKLAFEVIRNSHDRGSPLLPPAVRACGRRSAARVKAVGLHGSQVVSRQPV